MLSSHTFRLPQSLRFFKPFPKAIVAVIVSNVGAGRVRGVDPGEVGSGSVRRT